MTALSASGFTAAELTEQIAAYKAALKAIATGQEYAVHGKRLTRADLAQVRETLSWLNAERQSLTRGTGPRTIVGRPRR
jgi:hypothetical protein